MKKSVWEILFCQVVKYKRPELIVQARAGGLLSKADEAFLKKIGAGQLR